ncbi:MAG TPA: helix-turn-helix transcriptional regulator [Thermosynechococcaceae cyanobacterium]
MTQERDQVSMFPSEDAKQKLAQSYAQLKQATGIDRAVWSRYFTGRRSPTLRQCQQAASALELDAIDFVAALLDRVATQSNSGGTD